MSGFQPGLRTSRDPELRSRNRRLGLILASIALIFFAGIIVKYTLLR